MSDNDAYQRQALADEVATLRARITRLEGALKPFAEISECGIGLIVDVCNDEHNLKCYECQRIINARQALVDGKDK